MVRFKPGIGAWELVPVHMHASELCGCALGYMNQRVGNSDWYGGNRMQRGSHKYAAMHFTMHQICVLGCEWLWKTGKANLSHACVVTGIELLCGFGTAGCDCTCGVVLAPCGGLHS